MPRPRKQFVGLSDGSTDIRGRKRQPPLQEVHAHDEQGRPRDVTFRGNPALQCPACLSTEVEPFGAINFFPVGDNTEPDAPARRMRCRTCRAKWWRPGL
jgi:hypothetical protein